MLIAKRIFLTIISYAIFVFCPLYASIPEDYDADEIDIPEGKLREFCEAYILDAIDNLDDYDSRAKGTIINAYADYWGKESAKRLRELLDNDDLYVIENAAYGIGLIKDKESIPKLKEILLTKKLQMPDVEFQCEKHKDRVFYVPDVCPKCNAPLVPKQEILRKRLSIVIVQISVAATLYEIGDPEGFRILKEISNEPYGHPAYWIIALRDTKESRELLLKLAENAEHDQKKSHAIGALLRLDKKKYMPEALELLKRGDSYTRYNIFAVLVELADSSLEPIFKEFLGNEDYKLMAAQGLVSIGKKEYLKVIEKSYSTILKDRDEKVFFYEFRKVSTAEQLPFLEKVIEVNRPSRIYAAATALIIMNSERH